MCLLAFHVGFSPSVPFLLAANREEAYVRPSRAPDLFIDSPPMMCGIDAVAGGTWLGVNAGALVVAVTNRPHKATTDQPRSRGLLCRDLLRCDSAKSAAEKAAHELQSGSYNGANYLVVDEDHAVVIHGGARIEPIELSAGLHLLTNGDVNDLEDARQQRARRLMQQAGYANAAEFITAAQRVCADTGEQSSVRHGSETTNASIIIRGQDRGTVSSSIITLGDDAADCRYLFAPGPPDRTDYIELSNPLRWLLGKAPREQDEDQPNAS